ncbi:hypothetical protein PG994_012365 [Apiospora phragmitis]|uniref:Uncharacterized protein n=1 Tax=Apiospora phragmitis TaxID=2905665 RepID=A0ABR1TVF2_9PEZI
MSQQQQQFTSTGRGGAGNISDASNSPKIQTKDLETPTLKHTVVTTGRGGSGNMRTNKDPARPGPSRTVVERQKSDGIAHVGRGGAANVVKLGSPEIPEVKEVKKAEGEEAVKRTKSPDGTLAAKGKEWLFGKKA